MRECGIMWKWARRASIAILAASALAAPALGQQAAHHSLAETFTQAAEADAANRSAEAQAGKLIEAKRKAAAARRTPASPRPPQPDAEAEQTDRRRAMAQHASLTEAARSLPPQVDQEPAKAADRLARGPLEAAPTLAPAAAKLAAVEPARPEGKPTTTLPRAISIEAPVSGASPSASPASPPAAPDLDRMAQKHVEDAGRLAERLKRVRQLRDARLAARTRVPDGSGQATDSDGPAPVPASSQLKRIAMGPAPETEPAEEEAAEAPAPLADGAEIAEAGGPRPRRLQDTRVTVLIHLAPGNYGIRRGRSTADPILCLPDGCYVSHGTDRPARFLPGRRALGFANTWGERAGACREQLACVFRDVDLGRLPGYLEPVDLHILKHDRRRGQEVATSSACAVDDGRLICHAGLYTADYAMWIVPERLAAAAGPAALQRALAEGLNGPHPTDTSLRWRGSEPKF